MARRRRSKMRPVVLVSRRSILLFEQVEGEIPGGVTESASDL